MKKTFIYMVNGSEFHTEEAWGPEWKKAVTIAKAEHCEIWKAEVLGTEVRNYFYAKGDCFLAERFYKKEKVKLF